MDTRRVAMLLVGALGCREPLPCDDCDPDDPPPDLPCGGADLENDSANCGECGHACELTYAGTPYEIGGCENGTCSTARWFGRQVDPLRPGAPPPPELRCDDLCADFGTTCVFRGCSGKTGYSCATLFGTECEFADDRPLAWSGPCNEGVPWPELGSPTGGVPQVGCCCESVEP